MMLSIRGIFNGKMVELLEEVPYQNNVAVIVTFLEDEAVACRQPDAVNSEDRSAGDDGKPMQNAERALMREQFLCQRIAEGATNEELQRLIADMDRIDREFETDLHKRRTEAKSYADGKLKEWCEKRGVAYSPTNDLMISDVINGAIKQVRETNKQGRKNK